MPAVDVSAVVQNKARAVGAEDWLDALPDLVGELAAEWSIDVGEPYSGGTEAYVARATLADGTPAVLKLLVPQSSDFAQHEITVLRVTDGQGCVRLLRSDADRGALLLERLGPSLFDLGRPLGERLVILTDVAASVWRPAPGSGLPTGADKARWLIDHIETLWEKLDRPCSEQAVAHARTCAERRIAAHDDERAVLVHGDIHQWNALQAADGFRLVDPDGLLAEAEADIGILLREDPVELLEGDPWDRARWLAARTGLDVDAIWEWGVVERVSTGLACAEVGLEPFDRQMLDVADRIAAMR